MTTLPTGGKTSQNPATGDDAQHHYCVALGIDLEKGKYTSFHDRVRREYHLHTLQYWFVATCANGLLWMQIVIGAALTALGASTAPGTKTATIYLGAASTVIAGLLTYFKSRNQPNRSRQLRQGLKQTRNKMEQQLDEMKESTDVAEAHRRAANIVKMYDDAIREAANNYPDLWVTMSDLRKYFFKTDQEQQQQQESASNNAAERTNVPVHQPAEDHVQPAASNTAPVAMGEKDEVDLVRHDSTIVPAASSSHDSLRISVDAPESKLSPHFTLQPTAALAKHKQRAMPQFEIRRHENLGNTDVSSLTDVAKANITRLGLPPASSHAPDLSHYNDHTTIGIPSSSVQDAAIARLTPTPPSSSLSRNSASDSVGQPEKSVLSVAPTVPGEQPLSPGVPHKDGILVRSRTTGGFVWKQP